MEDKLNMMFEGTVANGTLSCNPVIPEVESLNSKGKRVSREKIVNDSDTDDFVHYPKRSNAGECSSEPKKQVDIHKGKRKKKVAAHLLQPDISNLVAAVSGINTGLLQMTSKHTIEDVMEIIEGIPELINDWDLYMNSIRIMEKPTVRDLFMTISPANRLRFLRHYKDHP